MTRGRVELLLMAHDGMDVVMGPYLWVVLDGPDVRAMSDPAVASEIVLRKFGTDWQPVGSSELFEDVTIRAAVKGECDAPTPH